jgi:hypothetical protein
VVSVVELRQYSLVPGRRDELIDLFEAELVAPQERVGMQIIGTFRDLSDETRFVWIRGFPDMVRRAASLAAFYGGSVWRRHRDAANATMLDSDDVLLLRPAWPGSSFNPARFGSEAARAGIVQLGIASFQSPIDDAALAYFSDEIEPRLDRAGASILACLISERAVNTFPALPVREDENVLVWFAGLSEARSPLVQSESLALDRAISRWPGAAGAAEVRLLSPTRGSRLTGTCGTAFTSRRLAHSSA